MMKSWKSRRICIASALSMAFVLSSAPAWSLTSPTAQAVQVLESDTSPRPLTQDELEYAKFVAKHAEVAEADVYRSIRYTSNVEKIDATFSRLYPDTYVDTSLSRLASDPYDVVVRFAGDIPESATAYLRTQPLDAQIMGGLPFGTSTLTKVQQAAYKAVFNNPLVLDSSSSIDEETGRIRIDATSSTIGLQSTLQETVNRVVRELSSGATLPTVEVVVVPDRVTSADVLTGGATLSVGTSATVGCTAGFTVRVANNTSRTGLYTAAHCSDSLGYERRDVIQYQGELLRNGSNTDVQWHETKNGETIRNYIIYESGLQTKRVIGSGNPSKGAYLCRWGDTTKAQCDTVRSILGICRDGYCSLTEMYKREADGGDSGGPWWQGSGADAIARGIHSGRFARSGEGFHDVFSPIATANSQLGVTVFVG